MSEDGIEEIILPFSLDETCGDLGAAAEANPSGQGGLVSSDRAMDLLNIRSHRLGVGSHFPHAVVSLCLPLQQLLLPGKQLLLACEQLLERGEVEAP